MHEWQWSPGLGVLFLCCSQKYLFPDEGTLLSGRVLKRCKHFLQFQIVGLNTNPCCQTGTASSLVERLNTLEALPRSRSPHAYLSEVSGGLPSSSATVGLICPACIAILQQTREKTQIRSVNRAATYMFIWPPFDNCLVSLPRSVSRETEAHY